ncbi:MAG: hypothetical protein ACAI43_05315 [Phycisphaerae bacterium]
MRMSLRRIGRVASVLTASLAVAVALAADAQAGGDPKTAKPPATAPATKPAGAPNVPASQLMDSLLRPASSGAQPLKPITDAPTVDLTTGKGAVAPGAPQLNLMREGAYVVDRVGRLTKGADGQSYELTFDADGKTLKDPPMVILPNQKLMQMENAVQGSNRDIRFRVTGMVTEYKGRNYVLLEKVVVVPDVQQF